MMLPPVALTLPESSILSSGSILLGQALSSGRPVVMDDDAVCRHTLVVGTTGSGKTELLLGMSESSMLSGGGVLFVDGKGDHATWAQMQSMARSAGRGEDVMLVNFGKGDSCTCNPFAYLSADEASTLLIASQPTLHDGMWQQRAATLMRTACMLACHEAMTEGVPLLPTRIRDCMRLPNLCAALARTDLPIMVSSSIESYLSTVPGFRNGSAGQSDTTIDQHGYLSMQWTAVMGLLCDTYGHIFREPATVDMQDVLRNGRILYISLPSMNRSSADVSLLGSLVFSALRTAMLGIMPSRSTGTWREVAESGFTRGVPPVLCIFDEVNHYMTPGMGIMASQARSLGLGIVFATQDVESMYMSNPREASLVMSNVGTRMFMRQVNPDNHMLQGLLPSNELSPEKSARRNRRDVMLRLSIATSNLHQLRLQMAGIWGGDKSGGDVMREDMLPHQRAEFARAKRDVDEDEADPDWNLLSILRSLSAGEFIAVQGREFLVCRAIHASKGLEEIDLALPDMTALSTAWHSISYDLPALASALPENVRVTLSLHVSALVAADGISDGVADIHSVSENNDASDFNKELLA